MSLIFRFPTDEDRKAQWVKNIKREHFIPSSTTCICSDHFSEEFICRLGSRVRLTPDAIPTRFKTHPNQLKEVTRSETYYPSPLK